MKTYKLTLSSDSGNHAITTNASSEEMARKIIMDAEGCPESAIIKCVEVIQEDVRQAIKKAEQ